MIVYLIGYDKAGPSYDYAPLIQAIKNLGDCRDILDSTWLVVCNLTAIQIRDQLITFMRTNDKLFISEVTQNSAWFLSPPHSVWLTSLV